MSLKLVTIKSNRQCLSFLKRAAENGASDLAQGKNLLLKPWFDKIAELVTPFEAAMRAQLHTHAKRAEEIAARNRVVTVMKHTVRDFRSALMRRVRRNGEPEIVLQYYRMPHERKPVADDHWYQLGEWLLDGETKALSKGFPAMTNPTADELSKALAAFADLRGNAEEADRRYRDAQDALVDLRKETQLAARGLAANFRVLLHDKDAPAIRRIMRSYGFQFRGEPEETVNEEPNLESSPEVERLEAGEKDPTAKAEEEPSAGKADVSAASFEPRFGRIPGTAPIKTREPGSADCSSCDIEARIARPPRRDLSPGDATRLISPRGEMDGLQPAGRRRSREKLPSTAYHEPVCGSPSPREEGSAGNLATTGHNHPGTS